MSGVPTKEYKPLESLENYSLPVTEYIPKDFLRVRHPNLSWVGAFLQGIANGRSVKYAAEQAGVSRGEVYFERDANPEFKEAWEEAVRMNTEGLEAAAHDRAVEKSDLLMMFLLKSRDPGRFNDKAQGQKGKELHIEITHRYPDKEALPTIEVQSRAVTPDSHQLTDEHTDPINVTPRKD